MFFVKESDIMKIDENFVIRQIADEYIIVPVGEALLNFNGMITVNELGKFIWEQLHEDLTKEQLLDRIVNEYEVDIQTASKDLEEFIHKLELGGLIRQ